MRSITRTHSTIRTADRLVVRAPHLTMWVDILFRLRQDPQDRRARIQAALLTQDGVDQCARCTASLTLEGFAETRTEFVERRALCCRSCGTAYVLSEQQIA